MRAGEITHMMTRERSQALRLGVAFEAKALISGMGAKAYEVARLRAEEASSDAMARDWTSVAEAIARQTGKSHASFLAAMFH
jgi:hypothetical protein